MLCESVGLGCGLRSCISNKLPGDAHPAGPQTTPHLECKALTRLHLDFCPDQKTYIFTFIHQILSEYQPDARQLSSSYTGCLGQGSPRRRHLSTDLKLGKKMSQADGWQEKPSKVQKSSGVRKPPMLRELQGGSSHTFFPWLLLDRTRLVFFLPLSQWPLWVFSSSLPRKCQNASRLRAWFPLSARTALVT